jgi:hypothetical protein
MLGRLDALLLLPLLLLPSPFVSLGLSRRSDCRLTVDDVDVVLADGVVAPVDEDDVASVSGVKCCMSSASVAASADTHRVSMCTHNTRTSSDSQRR